MVEAQNIGKILLVGGQFYALCTAERNVHERSREFE
jgi:hypothetical protein